MMNVEDVTASLVREFLSRKGLKNTLTVLDNELPRTELSISKRTALARAIHIESLVQRNKMEHTSPYRTILEVLIQYIISNPIDNCQSLNKSTTPKSVADNSPPLIMSPPPLTSPPLVADSPNGNPITFNTRTHTLISGKRTHLVSGISKTGLGSKGRRHAPSSRGLTKDDDPMKMSVLAQGRKQLVSHDMSHDYETKTVVSISKKTDDSGGMLEMSHDQSHDKGSVKETVLFEDIEDVVVIDTPTIPVKEPSYNIKGTPITSETAQSLRELVFGSAKGPSFNNEWRIQGFTFSTHIPYEIVQHKGGPCGLLACCQAYLLKYILFTTNTKGMTEIPNLSVPQQTEALVNSLSDILWIVRSQTAIVALKSYGVSNNVVKTFRYTPDGITEKLLLYEFSDYILLTNFISQHIRSFVSDSDGAIILLYSVILSHTVARIRSEMDNPNNTLIGSHGYCSQDLVNLMLTGTACSNVFDGKLILDSSVKDSPLLRGVSSPCQIGYLTLYEHYGVCQVGSYYKNPSLPIWVVCSESHYTVLFGLTKDNGLSKDDVIDNKVSPSSFSLHYCDGLAHFTEPIILEITINNSTAVDTTGNTEMTPPLELIIRTRWSNCSLVKWNCEPLL